MSTSAPRFTTASPTLQAHMGLLKIEPTPGFEGRAVKIGAETLSRWKAVYKHVDEWPAALQAIDDYCAAHPTDNAKQIARASAWLERRNHENRNDSEEAFRKRARSF